MSTTELLITMVIQTKAKININNKQLNGNSKKREKNVKTREVLYIIIIINKYKTKECNKTIAN